tara:strand:+ start:1103 stop:1384 length:282 start_codon:yes stop_codon:yes gene_type:complete
MYTQGVSIYKEFKMQLKDWLEKHKVSQAAFGKMMGVSQANVSRWSGMIQFPDPINLYKISRITKNKVTANDFVQNWVVDVEPEILEVNNGKAK